MKISRFIPAIVWLCFSFYLFTLPGNQLPKINWFNQVHGDKFVHMGIFSLLVFLFTFPSRKKPQPQFLRTALLVTLTAVLYGIAIEFIQKFFVPFRSFEITDILADSIGSFIPYTYFLSRLRKANA